MTGRIWTRMTPKKIVHCLEERMGLNVSATTVHRILTQLQYSLKGNKKGLSCGFHPDRDQQFTIIKHLREQFMAAGDPIISVDTKKKELIGLFKNPGRTWSRKAKEVKDHDFRSEADAIASPYGIYDLTNNCGVLVVGKSADTPEFAVNCIAMWWRRNGRFQYPGSNRLLILADSGGSNGARPRTFKKFLQERVADQFGMELTVSHYPTGASKWNPIEHRMFSEISKNWAGHPLESLETLLNFARHTKTNTGLKVEAYFDPREYEKGIKVPDKEFKQLNITKSETLGNWNYTIAARSVVAEEPYRVDTNPFLNTENGTKLRVAI